MKTKSPLQDFTYQEIMRQQAGWEKALDHLAANAGELGEFIDRFRDHVWVFSGCGTSYYLAQTASFTFQYLAGVRSKAVPASEILMYPEVIFNGTEKYLLLPISRSGTTSEIVKAAQIVRDKLKISTLAISCNPLSPLSQESDHRLTFPFEKERSVVMTSSFTTMLLALFQLAATMANDEKLIGQLRQVPEISSGILKKNETLIRQIAANGISKDFVFLGQGPMLGIANEAALKMQEMTISVSHGYHALEYRHGPMSTAAKQTLMIILCCEPARIYEEPLAKDLKSLGAKVLVIHDGQSGIFSRHADYEVITGGGINDALKPLLYMPLLQLLAYYHALSKGINPDQPKNLSQVVELNI